MHTEIAGRPADVTGMTRAIVRRVDRDGTVWVAAGAHEGEPVACDILATSRDGRLRLREGDAVLCWLGDARRGVVMGRLVDPAADEADAEVPDELVIEAGRALVLRVGDGSIEIRADGKILIKGKDLVSHAQRTNRIRGGAVAIN